MAARKIILKFIISRRGLSGITGVAKGLAFVITLSGADQRFD
jgi:hypothetical protein